MLGLKFNHVSKRGPLCTTMDYVLCAIYSKVGLRMEWYLLNKDKCSQCYIYKYYSILRPTLYSKVGLRMEWYLLTKTHVLLDKLAIFKLVKVDHVHIIQDIPDIHRLGYVITVIADNLELNRSQVISIHHPDLTMTTLWYELAQRGEWRI